MDLCKDLMQYLVPTQKYKKTHKQLRLHLKNSIINSILFLGIFKIDCRLVYLLNIFYFCMIFSI